MVSSQFFLNKKNAVLVICWENAFIVFFVTLPILSNMESYVQKSLEHSEDGILGICISSVV